MGSNRRTGSQRLIDIAQQLRLHKPLEDTTNTNNPLDADSGAKDIEENVLAAQESDLNADATANQPGKRSGPNRAAVLICLFEGEEGELRVILTKRSSTLSTHSGDVSLPGGKAEEGDADDIQTALREAKEEIGLDPSLVDVVTVLEPFTTLRGMTVVPVIGILSDKKAFIAPNVAEVESIFDAPLEMFLKDENRTAVEKECMGDKYLLHFFDHEAESQKYVIWALTAGILINAASLVYQRPPVFLERRPKFWNPKSWNRSRH